MPIDPRQYDSAIDFIANEAEFSKAIGNMANLDDKLRLKVYELYEDMYNNRPEHMRVTLRGEEDDSVEIYMPSAKKVIEAINRYLCVGWDYWIDPNVGSKSDQEDIDAAIQNIFKKQQFYRKFNQMKRYMLMKGDACFYILGKDWERPGRRITIEELKPEHYFPIEDLVTGELMGCHIVDIIRNPRSTPNTKRYAPEYVTRRQTYRKEVDDNLVPTGRVTSELTLWEIGRWDDRIPWLELSWVDTITSEFYLPEQITELPVYHFANNPPPTSTFGMSELAGVESLITAINQAMSDEDLTLITQGLGVYWTDASAPKGPNGETAEWEIGPGSVVEIGAGGKFGRVTGVSSVTPYLEHILALDESLQQALGVPDIAIGMVDVATAESGIALNFKMGPLLAKNAEKELFIIDVADRLLEDLVCCWLPAYEELAVDGISISSVVKNPTPKNDSQLLQDLLGIYGECDNVIPVGMLYQQLNDIMGWDLTQKDFDQALNDALRIAQNAAKAAPPGAAGGAGKPGSTGPASNKGGAAASQIDNLTKYTQSERLSRQTTGRNTGTPSGVTDAISAGAL